MKLTIYGTGYVGLVTGACLANSGHKVTCVDIDKKKIQDLNEGVVSLFEPGLQSMVKESMSNNLLFFTTDSSEALEEADACFICVGTPDSGDGSTDLSQVISAAESIEKNLKQDLFLFIKSTVPVGTCRKLQLDFNKKLKSKNLKVKVASNPEFLKEGSAVEDFNRPDRIIVGSEHEECRSIAKEIYGASNRIKDKIIFMSAESSELSKYASNAMLATRISFMNEIARFASISGADIEDVRNGIGTDSRIGNKFLYAGCGFGGSCFPKDLNSLIKQAKDEGEEFSLLESVKEVNDEQKNILYELACEVLNFNQSTKIAVWGLSYKPNTDDIRDAPSLNLISDLSKTGSIISAYDPQAIPNTKNYFSELKNLSFTDNKYTVLAEADVLFICTEWKEFWNPNFSKIKDLMKNPLIIDGRNIFESEDMKMKGIKYIGIGRKNFL